MSNFDTINTAIKTDILDGMTGEGKLFSTASDWPNPDPQSGYPHVFPLPVNSNEDDYDTDNNVKRLGFIIRCVFLDSKDRDTHIFMLKAVDALEAELRKKSHATLGGDCHKFYTGARGQFLRTSEGEVPLIVYDVEVYAEVLKSITL